MDRTAKNQFPLKLNLQLFAEDSASGGGAAVTGGAEADSGSNLASGNGETPGGSNAGVASGDSNKGGEGAKTFTQDDVNRIIQDRLTKERQKWEKEFETKLTEAKTEAEKLAKMNAEQKAEYERKKREEELAKREAEITRRELRATALETLAEKGLPKQLADILVYTDAEACQKSIENVEKVFREAVEAAVNERLKGDPPKSGGGGKGNAVFEEIQKIFQQR